MLWRAGTMLGSNVGTGEGGTASGAATLAAGEANALAFVFTDNHFQATTGCYGSAYVLDAGTPSNDYDSSPVIAASSLLTYSAPSNKFVLGPNGTLGYAPHNLYLNSAAPANQSVTVISGASYAITLTGSVSITASGAATGTWTAGTNTFTAATTTLTLGSTSGSGTVHLRRTPIHTDTYLATAGSARYDLPYEWDSAGNLLGIKPEPSRLNYAANSQTFTEMDAGARLTVTANTTVSPDGRTNASTLTAIAGTGGKRARTVMYTGVAPTTTHTHWAIFKAGTYDIVQIMNEGNAGYYCNFDLTNGTVGTAGAKTTGYITELVDGWYICEAVYDNTSSVNTGSYIYVVNSTSSAWGEGSTTVTGTIFAYHYQLEAGGRRTSPILTYTTGVTRAADNISLATSAFEWSATAATIYVKYRPIDVTTERRAIQIDDGTSNERITLGSDGSGNAFSQIVDGGANQLGPLTTGAVTGSAFERQAISIAANDVALVSDGGAEVTDTSVTLPTVTTVRLGAGLSAASPLDGYIGEILILPRTSTEAELQGYGA